MAIHGGEALSKMKDHDYALIFMDVQMPVMDGLEATQIIRLNEQSENRSTYVPIIAMTANAEKQECYEAGMNDYVFKPVTLDQLEKMIERWIS